MKYCSKCGNQLLDEAVFCPKCGCAVDNRYAPTPAPTQQTTASGTNGFAIAGFICAFFIPLLGWIFGGIGISKANKMGGKGKGLAVAAIIISTVVFIFSIILSIAYSAVIFGNIINMYS